MKTTYEKLKINLDEKLPKPSKWDVKEFSSYLSIEKKNKNNFNNRKMSEVERNFEKKKINKFLELTNESFLPKNPKIYYSSIPLSKNIKTFKDHPVLFGYYQAWVDHCPISISPNIIWQLIINVIIKYFDNNSEILRENFVNFQEGKQTIIVDRRNININKATKEDWEGVIDEFSSKIKENIKDNFYDNIVLNFTTNTKELLLVQKISSMAMFKTYFEYKALFHEMCGFPYIELEGSLEDWELILKKIEQFLIYGLENWIAKIEVIIQIIIDTKKGKIDIPFWKNLIMFKNSCGICGEPDPYIGFTGWITNFFPFNNKGEYYGENYKNSKFEIYNIEKKDPMSEIVVTPLKIHLIDTNKDIDLSIYSGILGISQDPITLCVKPELGFLITKKVKEKINPDPYEIKKNKCLSLNKHCLIF